MGTPEFAVPSLEAMLAAGVEVAGVITQPDRPAGRGQEPQASPIKRLAAGRNIPVFQPLKIKHPDAVAWVHAARPDVIVVVGYGQIIPPAVFDCPKLGTINVHASLLPRYRGAAPIQWAIARGETVTGVTTMRIDAGLDTGDILLQSEVSIAAQENAPELGRRLARAGAELLVRTLQQIDTIPPRKQDPAEATYAPILTKEDGRVDWGRPNREIAGQVRGFHPWPGAYTTFRGSLVHLRRVEPVAGPPSRPGVLEVQGGSLRAACGQGWLDLLELQPEGKKLMSARDFINGRRPASGDLLGEDHP